MARKNVVLGGAGLIGSYLCSELLKMGDEVLCVDNFSSGSEKNVEALLHNNNFHLLQHDITKILYVDADDIYHVASPQNDEIATLEASVHGVFNALGLARRNSAKMLFASSYTVYGASDRPLKEESFSPIDPCYALGDIEGKRCAEAFMMSFYRKYNITVKIARLFPTYGPSYATNNNFINSVLFGAKESNFAADSKVAFCYVSDVVEALIALMRSGYVGAVNVGSGTAMTYKEAVGTILDVTGEKLTVKYGTCKDSLVADISFAKSILDWDPKISLKEGVRTMVEDELLEMTT